MLLVFVLLMCVCVFFLESRSPKQRHLRFGRQGEMGKRDRAVTKGKKTEAKGEQGMAGKLAIFKEKENEIKGGGGNPVDICGCL